MLTGQLLSKDVLLLFISAYFRQPFLLLNIYQSLSWYRSRHQSLYARHVACSIIHLTSGLTITSCMRFFAFCAGRWERRRDPRGRVFYIDHTTRTTSWDPPVRSANTPLPSGYEMHDCPCTNTMTHPSRNSRILLIAGDRFRLRAISSSISAVRCVVSRVCPQHLRTPSPPSHSGLKSGKMHTDASTTWTTTSAPPHGAAQRSTTSRP